MKYFKKGNFIIVKDASDQEKHSFNLATINRVEIDDLQKKIKFGDGELNFSNFISFTLEDGTIKLKADFPNFSDLKTWALSNFFFVAKSGGGTGGGTDKGIWNPKTNTPDIFTLLTNSGEFAVIDGLDAGETYNFDFGGTKGGVVAFTIGDKVYFNGVIFQKQETYIPSADEITYDKTSPILGSVKDIVDLKANSSDVYTKTQADNFLNAKENTINAGTTSQYFRGDKTFQPLNKNVVGLSNVDNTSDLNKPLSTATQNALDLKANQSTTYNKTEVDNALILKADKTQIRNEVLKLTYLLY